MRDLINYAHRGASAYAPENTFAAFYLGRQMNANGIETDIQATKDGVLVLFHDDTLQRVAGLDVTIQDLTFEELCRIDVGSHKGPQYAGERVPTLEEFLHHFAGKGLHLALEIKQAGIEKEIAEAVRQWCDPDKTIVTSFIWESLTVMRRIAPEIRTGYLSLHEDEEVLQNMKKEGIYQYCPLASAWTKEWDQVFRKEGFSIRAWGVQNEELMMKMLDLGVDGMTVNFPDKLNEALQRMEEESSASADSIS